MQDEWWKKKADEIETYAATQNSKMFFSSGKSPGTEGISAEIFKSACSVALKALHSLLTSIWEEEDVSKEFRNATLAPHPPPPTPLFKNRDSKTDFGNYRGISLLSVAGKILAQVILNRLIINISEENLRKHSVNSFQTATTPT